MKGIKSVLITVACLATLATASTSQAFFLDFENGTEGARVNDISGVSFLNYGGFAPIYADLRTGAYNGHSDNLNYGPGPFHLNGNFTIWAGPEANAQGVKIDFTNNDGTWFKTGYSAGSNFYVDAFFTDGSSTTGIGGANLNSPMGYIQVNALAGKFIDYVVLHDSGNFWIADDMSGDASGVIPPSVPEPSTMLLLGGGLAGLAFWRRKQQVK